MVEIEYFIALCDILPQLEDFNKEKYGSLRSLYQDFTLNDAITIKNIEKKTNHDVKAVEYFLNEKFGQMEIVEKHRNFLHYALTSYDTNGVANPLLHKGAIEDVYTQNYQMVIDAINNFVEQYKDIPMLAHTH
jgi:adenylosuccinate lyase